MICPKCGHQEFHTNSPCPACSFQGEPGLLEKLGQLNFLLGELGGWADLPDSYRERLRRRYGLQRRELEVVLGLRQPPLDAARAGQVQVELGGLKVMLDTLPRLIQKGVISATVAQNLEAECLARQIQLRALMEDAPPVPTASPLEVVRFLARALEELQRSGRVHDPAAYAQVYQELSADIERREVSLGLRPRPAAAPPAPPKSPSPPPASQPARPPRPPLTWERVMETLLSERTLQAMLFLGVALLFAAAVSLIVWNWGLFPPWLQVTFLALFTAFFYGLGWYLRVRLKLHGSGIALTAVGSLLVPLDFYAIYLSRGFPAEWWAEVWLLASGLCLLAYLLTVYWLQAEFFGYLVGLAAGSLLAAAMQVGGIERAWWQAALVALALVLALLSEGLFREKPRAWLVLATPLWRTALVAVVVILVLGSAQGVARFAADRSYRAALALDWALGGLVFGLAAARFRRRPYALAAAGSFPLAVLLAQQALFPLWGWRSPHHSLGLALLAPLYLVAAQRLATRLAAAIWRAYSRIAAGWAATLIGVAALWALANTDVVSYVHPLLAASLFLAAWLWQRPRLSFFASLLLLSASAAAGAGQGATVAQLGLAWSLLAILHISAAVWLGRAKRPVASPKAAAPEPAFDWPLYAAGWMIAALALLPPLFTFERNILTYSLGNWIAINGWLALLAYEGERPGLIAWQQVWLRRSKNHAPGGAQPGATFPVAAQARGEAGAGLAGLFHWAASLALLPWAGLLWTNRRPPEAALGLLYVLLAFGLLACGSRLQQARRAYGRPWHTSARLSLLAGLALSVMAYDQPWTAGIWLLAAAYAFSAARLLQRRNWLLAGGGFFPVGWILAIDWLVDAPDTYPLALALVPLAYIAAAIGLERRRGSRAFFRPLYQAAQAVALVAFLWGIWLILGYQPSDALLLWVAAANLALAAGIGLYSWWFNDRDSGHLTAWLGVIAGGLAASALSQGSGRSAALAALLAWAYVLAERGLLWLGLARRLAPTWRARFRRGWRLYRGPLLTAGWCVSLGTAGLALVRNLLILGGGRTRLSWAFLATLLVTGLYALSVYLFRRRAQAASRLAWAAALLLPVPWTLLAGLGWFFWQPPAAPGYAIPWVVLALLELLTGIGLAGLAGRRPGNENLQDWARPPQVIAHLLLPAALLWGAGHAATASVTFGLAALFYLLAVWNDRRGQNGPVTLRQSRYLYPAIFALPVWALYLLAHFAPHAAQTVFGGVLLLFPLPALAAGRRVERLARAYRWPFYLAAYGTLLAGLALVAHDRPALIAGLLFATLVCSLSAFSFRSPLFVYPASAALPAALILALAEAGVPANRYGWALIALGGLYLAVAQGLRGRRLSGTSPAAPGSSPYGIPLLAAAFTLVALGLPLSSQERWTAIGGYAGAAALYGLAAVWLRQPLLVTPAVGLAVVPYWLGILEAGIPPLDRGLVLWPGIILALATAYALDSRAGIQPGPDGSLGRAAFPWDNPPRWPAAVADRLVRWWALPLHAAAYLGAAFANLFSLEDAARLTLTLAATTLVYALAFDRFRLRGWLLLAAGTGQLCGLAAIHWIGLAERASLAALAFTPLTWATALAALLVARRFAESPPLGRRSQAGGRGWSRPLYLLLLIDLLLSQALTFPLSSEGHWLSLSHALLIGVVVTAWNAPGLAILAPILGVLALGQYLGFAQVAGTVWPWALALLALGYGLAGYGLSFLDRQGESVPDRARLWGSPLRQSGWMLSAASLLLAFVMGVPVIRLTLRAVLGLPLLQDQDVPRVQMVVSVLAVLGLLYLAAALVDRRRWLGYGAVGMLLAAWSLEWLLVWGQREVQWYALPAGAYLLVVGFLEWNYGTRSLARWIDRAGLLLLLGSSFWQSLGENGGPYALLMGVEGLLILWWGSARRMRRFLYAGVAGVTIDIAGQLIEPLLSANRWIVFGVSGALLVAIAVLIERRLDDVLSMSQDVRQRLERWE